MKFISLVLTIVIMISAIPATAYAAKVKAPAKPISLNAVAAETAITVKWKKVKGASGYILYNYNTKTKKYSKKATTSKTSYKVNKLNSGTNYIYAVKSYKTVKKKKYYSAYSAKLTATTLPSKPENVKITALSDSQAKVTWNKVNGATSYKIQYTDSDWSKAKSITSKTNSIILSSLKAASKYTVRVYAIKTLNKKNYTSSASSSVKTTTYHLTNIDLNKTHQTITGFGASGAWWAKKVGGWENAEDFIKLLYSKDEGIGLNIYRYNLGAGTDTDEKVNLGARAETFVTSIDYNQKDASEDWVDFDIHYDWTRDVNARKVLEIADKYADDLNVVLFANSPPKQMTVNGKGYCSYHEDSYWENDRFIKVDSYKTNLARSNFNVYAQYLTDCADHFIEEGYNITEVSPINEPQYAWSCDKNGYMSQEGCYYTPSDFKALTAKMAQYGNGKPYKFSMFESCGVAGTLWNLDYIWQDCFRTYFDPLFTNNNIKRYYDTVAVHSYWNNKEDKAKFKEYMNESHPEFKIACTEYCQMTNDVNTGVWDIQQTLNGFDYNGMGIEHGVQLARTVFEDLTVLDATEWNWWTGISGGYYPDGLVYYDGETIGDAVWDSSAKEIYPSKRLWCLGNFSKFIRQGAVRVDANSSSSDILSCAFKNTDGSLVIVFVNTTDKAKDTYINASGYTKADYYLTSECCDLENTFSATNVRNQRFTIPEKSVVSVIMTN